METTREEKDIAVVVEITGMRLCIVNPAEGIDADELRKAIETGLYRGMEVHTSGLSGPDLKLSAAGREITAERPDGSKIRLGRWGGNWRDISLEGKIKRTEVQAGERRDGDAADDSARACDPPPKAPTALDIVFGPDSQARARPNAETLDIIRDLRRKRD